MGVWVAEVIRFVFGKYMVEKVQQHHLKNKKANEQQELCEWGVLKSQFFCYRGFSDTAKMHLCGETSDARVIQRPSNFRLWWAFNNTPLLE